MGKTVRHTFTFFAPFLIACSASQPAPMPPPVVVAAAAPSIAAPPPPEPPEPPAPPPTPLPASVELALPVACTYATERFSGAKDVTDLALVPQGKPFLRINAGAAHVSIPTGSAGSLLLEIRDGGFVVRGHAAASAIVLRPNAPFVLNGFAIPTMYASLSYTQAADGSITVMHRQPAEIDLFGATLEGTRPCSDLGLESNRFDATESIPGIDAKKQGATKLLDRGQKVDLRMEPKGKPVARLNLNDAALVFVSQTAGAMSRVSLPIDTLMVFGWVKSSELKEAGSMAGYGTGSGRRGIRDPELPITERLRCSTEVPLIAETDGERKLVGSIRENTVIEVISRTETEARIGVKTRAIHAVDGADFRVRASDLTDCKAVTIP